MCVSRDWELSSNCYPLPSPLHCLQRGRQLLDAASSTDFSLRRRSCRIDSLRPLFSPSQPIQPPSRILRCLNLAVLYASHLAASFSPPPALNELFTVVSIVFLPSCRHSCLSGSTAMVCGTGSVHKTVHFPRPPLPGRPPVLGGGSSAATMACGLEIRQLAERRVWVASK